MGMFDFWRTAPLSGDTPVQTLEVVPENPQQYVYPVLTDYRKGMWVKTSGGRIGILAKFTDLGAEVALTDAKGLNVAIEEYDLNNLVRAKRSEIPEARINHLSRAETRALGYED